jgi:hypothetical protein
MVMRVDPALHSFSIAPSERTMKRNSFRNDLVRSTSDLLSPARNGPLHQLFFELRIGSRTSGV